MDLRRAGRLPRPHFSLGTGPAGNLVSSVGDLGRFLSFLFAEGRGPAGAVVKPETLRSMIEPQRGKPGTSAGFGLGFAISKLEDECRIGHNGAVYGFATDVQALPDAKLGVVVIATADCANGVASEIADDRAADDALGAERTPLATLWLHQRRFTRERARALSRALRERQTTPSTSSSEVASSCSVHSRG